MFSWITRHIRNRQRQIFRYYDGSRWRSADPMVLYRSLDTHPEFNWETHPILVDKGDADALRLTMAAVDAAFGVHGLTADGKGLTEYERIELLATFVSWIAALKKNGWHWGTLQPATEPPPSGESITSVKSPSTSSSSVPTPGAYAHS